MSFTCCGDYLSICYRGPVAVGLFWDGLVRGVSEEAGECEQAFGVFEGAAKPVVMILFPFNGPFHIFVLWVVPAQTTLQFLWFHSLYIPPQVQLRTYKRTEFNQLK